MKNFMTFFRRRWIPVLFLCTLALYLSVTDHFFFFHGGDNAEYISLARSLLMGRGYANINTFPVTPHVKYPPVFPAMIALVMAVFGENILAIKVMIALCAAFAAGAAGLLWKDRENSYHAPLAALLAAAAPALLYYSVDIYSELPYTMFSLLALVFIERAFRREGAGKATVVLATVFVLLAAFTRSIGLVLGPALVLAALARPPVRAGLKRRATLALFMAGPLAVAAALWMARAHYLGQGASRGYLAEFMLAEPYFSASSAITAPGLCARVAANCGYYLDQLGVVLWPLAAKPVRGTAAAGAVILGISILGLVRESPKRGGAPEAYAVLYSAAALSWGFQQGRMLLPLVPLIFFYLLRGLDLLIGLAARPAVPRHAPRVIMVMLIALAAAFSAVQINTDSRLIRLAARGRSAEGYVINPAFRVIALDEGLGRVLAASAYLRDHAEPGAVVFARKPNLAALVSGHPAVGGPFAPDVAGFFRDLAERRVRYILVDEVFPEIPGSLRPALRAYPARFEPWYRVEGSRTVVYKFRWAE